MLRSKTARFLRRLAERIHPSRPRVSVRLMAEVGRYVEGMNRAERECEDGE